MRKMSQEMIAGRNPVLEALRAGRTIKKIIIAKGTKPAGVQEIIKLAQDNKVPVQWAARQQLDELVAGARHQGVVAAAAAIAYANLEDLLSIDANPFLLLLDEIHDPHNLGAIIRTADAAGVQGVIIPKRRSAQLTTTVAKASAGAVEHMPVARVTNLVQTIKKLQQEGIWVVGADMDGQALHWESDLTGPLALVIGGENKGLGRLVKETCDFVVRLPMMGQLNSLNASVAAGVLIYEVVRQQMQGKSDA